MLQCNECKYKPSEEDYCQEGSMIDAAMGKCEHFAAANDWLTHVRYGDALNDYIAIGKQYARRACFRQLLEHVQGDSRRICALYGLRRTGKTVLLYQLLAELDKNKTAYILLADKNDMSDLDTDLLRLLKIGITTVLIDEITFASDFASSSNLLADFYQMHGMKIVLTGTNSLGFIFASNYVLYDRIDFIHTTNIPYPEHKLLLGTSLDEYIKYGGTMLPEGQVPFSSTADAQEYMNSAIVSNIQHAFRVLDEDPNFYSALKSAYYEDRLTGIINLILDDVKHRFVTSIFKKAFKSSNLDTLRSKFISRLSKGDTTAEPPLIFIGMNRLAINTKYKEVLKIRGKVPSEEELSELQQYLFRLDVLTRYDVVDETFQSHKQVVFTQPGMQYSQAVALIEICREQSGFSSLEISEQQFILNFLRANTLGRILEDIVISSTMLHFDKQNTGDFPQILVFQYSYSGGEIDMIVVDTIAESMNLYEIKHSSEATVEQTRHLCSQEVCDHLAGHYYPIASRNVLYLGQSMTKYVNDSVFVTDANGGMQINYINVEEYLESLQ